MENGLVKMDELYRIYKQSKSVKLPFDCLFNQLAPDWAYKKIESGDLFFGWEMRRGRGKGILGILQKCWRLMEFNMPFLLKPVISFLSKNKESSYIIDGNAYAKVAIKKGAKYAVIDNKAVKKGDKFLLVENSLDTLRNLAALHRKKVNTQFVGITGSCGKSTTKELIKSVLSTKYNVEGTIGSQNGIYQIPQRVLNFNENTEIGVIEMAATGFDQVKKHCKVVQPDCGLITCIGKAHLKGFKSIEGVLKGKGELFEYLISTNGHIFKNLNDSGVQKLANNYKNITTYGSKEDSDIYGQIINTFPFLKIKWYPSKKSRRETYQMTTKLFGEYNLDNILAAISVGLHFDVPPKLINEAIQEYETISLRSQIKKLGTNTFILDSFNATPKSMKASLNNFHKMNVEKKIAILGDIAQLGNFSIEEHRNIINFMLPSGLTHWNHTDIRHSAWKYNFT